MAAQQDLARCRGHHQPSRQVHVVAQGAQGLAGQATVGTHTQDALRDAHLQLQLGPVAQRQGRLDRAPRIVFMRNQRPEVEVCVTALVTGGQLQDRAFVSDCDFLHQTDERVHTRLRVVGVVINASESDEEHRARAELRQERTPSR